MKRLLVTISAIALGLTATPASADHYRGHYHHHDHDNDAAVAAIVGGVIGAVAGYAIGSSQYHGYGYGYYGRGYPAYGYPAYGYGYSYPSYGYSYPAYGYSNYANVQAQMSSQSGNATYGDSTIALGQITVTASVSVSFVLR